MRTELPQVPEPSPDRPPSRATRTGASSPGVAGRLEIILAAFVLLSCASPATSSRPHSVPSGVVSLTQTVDPAAIRVMDLAKADLSRRTFVPPPEIQVMQVERRDWPDASLGCSAPGQVNAAVVTPGFRIILTSRAREYTYHTSMSQATPCPREG